MVRVGVSGTKARALARAMRKAFYPYSNDALHLLVLPVPPLVFFGVTANTFSCVNGMSLDPFACLLRPLVLPSLRPALARGALWRRLLLDQRLREVCPMFVIRRLSDSLCGVLYPY